MVSVLDVCTESARQTHSKRISLRIHTIERPTADLKHLSKHERGTRCRPTDEIGSSTEIFFEVECDKVAVGREPDDLGDS